MRECIRLLSLHRHIGLSLIRISLDSRLAELDYLLNNDLADVDCENWEEDTPFKDPRELYDFLKTEKPEEELVFSHGDLADSNIFVKDGKVSGFIDLGRSGRADKWYDIAFCVRSDQGGYRGRTVCRAIF